VAEGIEDAVEVREKGLFLIQAPGRERQRTLLLARDPLSRTKARSGWTSANSISGS